MRHPSISLCTPVWRRHRLTELLMARRAAGIEHLRNLGVRAQCVMVGDEPELREIARRHGFGWIEAPNVLGAKYNHGHEWALVSGYDVSLQCNSDQVFDPELLRALARTPQDKVALTHWLTAVHESGRKAISARNPTWAMTAYPAGLLEANPRPCDEDAMSGCDRSTLEGVVRANGLDLRIDDSESVWNVAGDDAAHLELGPLETIQFESGNQLTPWKRWLLVAMASRAAEGPVPWGGVAELHGQPFTDQMKEFYGA